MEGSGPEMEGSEPEMEGSELLATQGEMKGEWTENDDKRLLSVCEYVGINYKSGAEKWACIATYFQNKTMTQCAQRWKKLTTTGEDEIKQILSWRLAKSVEYSKVNPVLRCLIDGVCDEDSPLSKLNGLLQILLSIWNLVQEHWQKFITKGHISWYMHAGDENIFYVADVLEIDFPKPNGIYVNMMPFIMSGTFKGCKLPTYLRTYWEKIISKILKKHCIGEMGKVGYLTVHESFVKKGASQRRGGLHVETPGKIIVQEDTDGKYFYLGPANNLSHMDEYVLNVVQCIENDSIVNMESVGWGLGKHIEKMEFEGGIYMASNVEDSCEIWNCRINEGDDGREVIGDLGDIEHLRQLLGRSSSIMRANECYWLTDRTPHESLPLGEGVQRQYFRLVTSQVSVWFKDHSTKNPKGVTPDPHQTIIIKGSKFAPLEESLDTSTKSKKLSNVY